jgi:orotidine-5'-phosphate decarboxylase
MKELELKRRLAFALDVKANEVPDLLKTVTPHVGMVKVNRAFIAGGPTLMNAIAETGAFPFLDLKWKDIPETVMGYIEEAITAMPRLGMFNVHATGGFKMMAQGMEFLKGLWGDKPDRPLMIAVTVLTSLDGSDLESMGIKNLTVAEQAITLAKLAKEAGLDGVVASAKEVIGIRDAVGKDFIIVTPALRFPDVAIENDDQKRIAFVDTAIANGADIAVMGRPLIQGGIEAIKRAYALIEEGLTLRAA